MENAARRHQRVLHPYHLPSGPRPRTSHRTRLLPAHRVFHRGRRTALVRSGSHCQPKSAPTIAGDIVYFNGWTPVNDAGQQVELPTFAEVIAAADANHDGKLSQAELPQPWQPTGTWRAVALDRDGFLNGREWTFFRTR